MTLQRLHLGEQIWERESSPETPAFLSSAPMYLICSIGGVVHPYGDEHLVGRMGGAWAHPMRVLHGWSLSIESQDALTPLAPAQTCDLYGSHLTRHYRSAINISWTEFVVEARAALAGIITLHNPHDTAWEGALILHTELDLRGCWFGGWGAGETIIEKRGTQLMAVSSASSAAGHAAAVALKPAASWEISGATAQARIPIRLQPQQRIQCTIGLGVTHAGGVGTAADLAWEVCHHAEALLADKASRYEAVLSDVALETPDPLLNQAWQIARINFHTLQATYPDLPTYFLAGLPEYPQLFGCDNEYSTAGATAAGFGATARSTLLALASYGERACGRIPHEITTNGRVYHGGNTQETPQFAVACWEYARWSGDIELLSRLYPLLVEGMEHFSWVFAHHQYPSGDGVVERLGMGVHKLDSVCYLHQALIALSEIARLLDFHADVQRFSIQAAQLRERFERDWWLEDEQVYADSMHLDGRTQLDGHWTVVLPVQTGIAEPERARRSLQRILADWVNEWGLVHTRGGEARVWTLPTGLLALAAFQHGHAEAGLRLLRNIAVTTHHGSLGTLKELIPEGICFIQLWSAGLLISGVVEGLLGLTPNAHQHTLTIAPHLPPDWPEVRLHGIAIGAHRVDLRIRQQSIEVTHRSGSVPLTVSYAGQQQQIAIGARAELTRAMG
jgi:Glycosyl hydrolase family 65, C-terminal domain